MKRAGKILLLALAALVAASAGGCWDYNDPEEMIYVMGMAFDRNPDGRLRCTIEYATMKGEGQSTPVYIEVDGDSFFDAHNNAVKVAEKQLNWSHTQVIIVSQDIAKNNMSDLLDMVLRMPMMRDSLVLLVSKQPTASEILEAENPTGDLNSSDIIGTLRAEKQLQKAPNIHLYQFADAVADERQSAILPAVGIATTSRGKDVEVSGTAVFRGPWLQGFLDEYDTRALMMLDFGKNIYDMPLPADPGGKFTSAGVQFIVDRVEIVPEYSGGKASVSIFIRGSVTPVEISGATTDPEKFITVTNAILTNTSTKLENDVKEMMLHTQQMGGCDVLGIGNRMKASNPDVWRQINGHWREYYSNMDINVKAGLMIHNTGNEMQPLTKGD